jgi:hypothetical protein
MRFGSELILIRSSSELYHWKFGQDEMSRAEPALGGRLRLLKQDNVTLWRVRVTTVATDT